MNGYRFSLTCPDCGGELVERATRRLSPTRSSAEVWCERCLIIWRIDVGLTALDVIRLPADVEAGLRLRAGLALGPDVLEVFG